MFSMTGFVDEMVKIGVYATQVGQAVPELVGVAKFLRRMGGAAAKHKKPLGWTIGGGAGVLGAQRLGEDVILAERIRSMQRG